MTGLGAPDDGEAFRAEARAFLAAHASLRSGPTDWSNGPREHTEDAQREFFARCRAWQATLYEHGFAGLTWPREYGGRGASVWESIVFDQEQLRYDATSGFIAATVSMVGTALLGHGTAAQRDRYLSRLLSGRDTWCQLFSEPDAGSDLASLTTRAVRDGDYFVVNGQKVWTSYAQYCERALLLARTDQEAPKHRGITAMVVDLDTPGITIRPLRLITGHTHFNEVFLDNVRVPVDNVIGEIDGGWAVARAVLSSEATQVGTTVDFGDAAALIDLARERGCGNDPLTRQQLARVYTEERLLTLLNGRVLDAGRRGVRAEVDPSVLKVFWSEAKVRKDLVALGLLGASGLLYGTDAPHNGYWNTQVVNRYWATVGGGTSEVHRNMIAERALGLPR
jgi:alkylation response protein AidB-like acyl-CoA dehydrogenase